MPVLTVIDGQYIVTIANGQISIDKVTSPPANVSTTSVLANGAPHQALEAMEDIFVNP